MSDLIDPKRRDVLRFAVIGGVGLGVTGLTASGLALMEGAKAMDPATKSPTMSAPLRSIFGARQWLNMQPLKPEDALGKVVLVNFWTYSCINSLRMLPYVRAWNNKYKDHGLAVVGVHTPEFAFEKDILNVTKASALYDVSYPVPLDSDYVIWRAFGNDAWPALYFVDVSGRVRRRALGEGDYDKSEKLIQQMLSEAKSGGSIPSDLVADSGTGPEAAPDWKSLRSPETYIGYMRATNFASPGDIKRDAPAPYRAAPALKLNYWSLSRDWTVGQEFATLNSPTGSVLYRFHARDLHLIMGRSTQDRPIRFRVKIDGASPGADHGVDVNDEGNGVVEEERMYQLVRQKRAIADRTFEIEFLETGVRAYDFTFG